MSSSSERTEQATPRRRNRAKEEGQFAYSQELTAAVTLAVGLTTLSYTMLSGPRFRTFFSSLLDTATRGPASNQLLLQAIRQSGVFFLKAIAPALAAAALA